MTLMIFNETAKTRITLAYDLFKKEEFLERLFKFLSESEDLILTHERMKQQSETLCNKIIEGAKTKPGPKAKVEIERGCGDDYPIIPQ